jgi:hypothetical protein
LIQSGDIVRRQVVEEQLSHGRDVAGRGMLDRGTAGVGDRERGAAAVGEAVTPLDQVPPLHPGQLMRQAALLPAQAGFQFAGAQTLLRRLVQPREHVVVWQRELVLVLELPRETRVELGGHLEQPAPGPLLVVREPVRHANEPSGIHEVSSKLHDASSK